MSRRLLINRQGRTVSRVSCRRQGLLSTHALQDGLWLSPLVVAIRQNKQRIVQGLLAQGADPNALHATIVDDRTGRIRKHDLEHPSTSNLFLRWPAHVVRVCEKKGEEGGGKREN